MMDSYVRTAHVNIKSVNAQHKVNPHVNYDLQIMTINSLSVLTNAPY